MGQVQIQNIVSKDVDVKLLPVAHDTKKVGNYEKAAPGLLETSIRWDRLLEYRVCYGESELGPGSPPLVRSFANYALAWKFAQNLLDTGPYRNISLMALVEQDWHYVICGSGKYTKVSSQSKHYQIPPEWLLKKESVPPGIEIEKT